MHDVAAPVDEIEDDLQQDLDEVSEFGDENPLVAAAFWHARFEGVHAFADGNGRTGRAMMNYYLLLHNHPPIVIFDEDRKDYYAALDGFDMTGDLKPLIGFYVGRHVRHGRVQYREKIGPIRCRSKRREIL